MHPKLDEEGERIQYPVAIIMSSTKKNILLYLKADAFCEDLYIFNALL